MKDNRSKIIQRAVQEIQNGMNVNLGIGLPTLIANEIPQDYPWKNGERHGRIHGSGPWIQTGGCHYGTCKQTWGVQSEEGLFTSFDRTACRTTIDNRFGSF